MKADTKPKADAKVKARIADLPKVNIHVIRGAADEPPLCEYKVGMSRVTITRSSYVINDPPVDEEDLRRLEDAAARLLYIMPPEAVRDPALFDEYLRRYGLSDEVMQYYLRRELLGYGAYDVLMSDDALEDIISWPGKTTCSHKSYGVLDANVALDEEDFNRHVEKFVHMAGKSISLYNPIASIRLPSNDRLTVTYAREASALPSFAIRKFPRHPWSITSVMLMGTISPEMAAYLMLLVKYKKSMLVCGPVGSGKTSLINALCSLIPAEKVVTTVEDTPELSLARKNWVSLITRPSMTVEERGEIGMFELVKHALRQPNDYIIVGEVRGEEGRIWAQAIATGHGGITSLHAETPEGALVRLLSDPINVPEGAVRFLSCIVMVKPLIAGRRKIRRVTGIYSLEPAEGRSPPVEPRCAFRLTPDDSFETVRDPLETAPAREIMELVPDLEDEYRLYADFMERLRDLGASDPSLCDHRRVTELVWELYGAKSLPRALAAPELQVPAPEIEKGRRQL